MLRQSQIAAHLFPLGYVPPPWQYCKRAINRFYFRRFARVMHACMEDLSDKQRVWLDHVTACGKAGISMKAYAERHGLDLQQFYFWKGQLRKLRVIDADPKRRAAQPVSCTSTIYPDQKAVSKIHIQLANGISFEFPGDCDADAVASLLKIAVRF